MASIRRRKDTQSRRWVVDYRDAQGRRHWITCKSREEAERVRREKEVSPGDDPNLTFRDCAQRWLTITKTKVRPQSFAHYETYLRVHILPALGECKLWKMTPDLLLEFLAGKLNDGLRPLTVANLQTVLFSVFRFAIRMGVTKHNPVDGLSAELNLRKPGRNDEMKPFTEEELVRLLDVARDIKPKRRTNPLSAIDRDYPLIFTLVRTGLRLGEALALQWADMDFERRKIRIERRLDGGSVDLLKTETSRRYVDMSRKLRELLWDVRRKRNEERLRYGWGETPPWVFCGVNGRPFLRSTIEGRFKRILEAAGLPLHHTPHDLRHTFACLHLQRGKSPVYVQQQLGHASIKMTVDIYGRWFPVSDHDAADELDQNIEEARRRMMLEDRACEAEKE